MTEHTTETAQERLERRHAEIHRIWGQNLQDIDRTEKYGVVVILSSLIFLVGGLFWSLWLLAAIPVLCFVVPNILFNNLEERTHRRWEGLDNHEQ